jgi:hypothetical protein
MKRGECLQKCILVVSILILIAVAVYLLASTNFLGITGRMVGVTSNFANQNPEPDSVCIFPFIILACFVVIIIYWNIKRR